MTKRLILASSSTRRVSILKQIGYVPDLIVPADIDESEQKGESPRNLAIRLAYLKALKISKQYPNDVILGADTVVGVGRLILPKALKAEEASYCVEKLSGRRHRVYTGVCVINGKDVARRVSLSIVKFKHLSEEDKTNFLATKQWYGKAGGCTLYGFSSQFVEQLRGTETGVLGLPACVVSKLLTGVGIKADPAVSFEQSV